MTAPRVIELAPGEDGSAWADALSAPRWRDRADMLKRDGDTSVWRTQMRGRNVVIKVWSLRGLKRRLQVLIGASTPGRRQWRGAERLLRSGIATSQPYAIIRVARDGEYQELFVMEAIKGKSVLEHLAIGDLSVKQEHALAAALGDQIQAVIAKGLANYDHKPSNLIVTDCTDESARIAIVDTVAIIDGEEAADCEDGMWGMLYSLVIEPIGCACLPRKSLMMRTVVSVLKEDEGSSLPKYSKKVVRGIWSSIDGSVKCHGDPTPKIDPLAHVRRSVG